MSDFVENCVRMSSSIPQVNKKQFQFTSYLYVPWSNQRMIEILDGARMGSKWLDLAEMTSGVGQSSSSTVTPDSGHSPNILSQLVPNPQGCLGPLSSQHCSALSPSEASTMTSEQAVTNKDHHLSHLPVM